MVRDICALQEHGCRGNITYNTQFVRQHDNIITKDSKGVLTSHSFSLFSEVSEFLCRYCHRLQGALRKQYCAQKASKESIRTRSGKKLSVAPPSSAKRSRSEAELLRGAQDNLDLRDRAGPSSKRRPAPIAPPTTEAERTALQPKSNRKNRPAIAYQSSKSSTAGPPVETINLNAPAQQQPFQFCAKTPNTHLKPIEKDIKLKHQSVLLKRTRIELSRVKANNKQLKEDINKLQVLFTS
jgi:hypothetical protein